MSFKTKLTEVKVPIDADFQPVAVVCGSDLDARVKPLKVLDNGDGTYTLVTSSGSSPVAPEDEVFAWNPGADVAPGFSTEHSYVVPAGRVLKLSQVLFSSSGQVKVEVYAGPVGSEAQMATMFNTPSKLTDDVSWAEPKTILSGQRVLVVRTNVDGDGQSRASYSTIVGHLE